MVSVQYALLQFDIGTWAWFAKSISEARLGVIRFYLYHLLYPDNDNSDDIKLASGNVEAIVTFCFETYWPGSKTHMYCSALHFGPWFRRLVEEAKELKDSNDSADKEGKQCVSAGGCIWGVLNYATVRQKFKVDWQEPAPRKVYCTTLFEQAIHVWGQGLL